MNTNKSPHRRRIQFLQQPLFYVGVATIILILILISLFSGSRNTAAFSYQGGNCTERWTPLPGLMEQTEPSSYDLAFEDAIEVAGWPIVARQVCAVPVAAPAEGQEAIRYGLGGMTIGSRQLVLEVPGAPLAKQVDFLDREISVSQPLVIELTAADTIHQYDLSVGSETVRCDSEGEAIECDVTKLDLAQGKQYDSALVRTFDNQTVAEIGEGRLATLAPLKLENSSIKPGQVRFDEPRKFELEFSRALDETREVKLTHKDDGGGSDLPIKASMEGAKLTIANDQDLPRSAELELSIQDAIADNGSSLEEPISIDFKTSGGPKVSGVSVGNSAVPTKAQIVVTFDQPLADSVAPGEVARVTGVDGSVSRRAPNQLVFSLDAKLCSAFSLHVDEGVPSGSNQAVSADAWKFDSRTVCGTSSTIGYSVRGRPLIAHYFGSGSTTILFTGGIHGNELSAQQTMQGLVDYLYANAHSVIPADKRVVVVPNANPDGIATGSRNNVNNVNLGRNYPTANWKADTDTPAGILKNGGGKSPGSEPETKALMNLTRQLRPRLEVSFHSQGYLVGANKVADSVSIGTIYANTVGYRTMFYDAEAIMGYSMTGEYEGWMGEEMGIPAILIELPSHYGNYFPSQREAILKMLRV